MEKLISVIVPCYNVEKYVIKSIESIANQEYSNIEIIAIDDCSTDRTYAILKDLEENISNLKVLKNDKNQGVAYTRNFAIKHCKGEIIGFIDPDDYIDRKYYKTLCGKLKDNVEVVVTDIQLVNEVGEAIRPMTKCCEGEINKKNIVNNGFAASPCNKIFKKELLIEYPFLEGKMNEDVASIIPIIINCNKVDYVEGEQYYYVQRSTSVQNSIFSEKRFDMFDSIEVCLERIKDDKEYKDFMDVVIYNQVFTMYIYLLTEMDNFFKRQRFIETFLEKAKKYKLSNNTYVKEFIKKQNKTYGIYCYVLVKLTVFKNPILLNIVIGIKKLLKKIKDKTINILRVIYRKIFRKTIIKSKIGTRDLVIAAKKQATLQEHIKISVVVPNYNYEKFIYERLYSILNQTEKIYELIILDDCSSDNSCELIDEIVDELKEYINIQKVYNKENSGGAFKQWEKGFGLAKRRICMDSRS